ncbi:hypothetical protein ACPXCE_08265 [Streptomyces sp. DT24]|uniref:hypothetical protein n=1 Tax=Streptomyces sp. DT24 TaxID=3416520 RepID=UPI003CF7164D
MNAETIANAVASVIASLGALATIMSRRKRWRSDIRENLSLAEELEKNSLIREQTPAVAWLNTKIALDVAKLSGQNLGTPKKPIPWGSVFFSSSIMAAFGYWAYWLNSEGFVWYSVLPGIVAFLMAMSAYGSFLNREILPESESDLPDGAIPLRPEQASERISQNFNMMASTGDERFEEGRQIDVAFRFFTHAAKGEFDQAIALTDPNWLLCRIQAWLWNNQEHFGENIEVLENMAIEMIRDRSEHDAWADYKESEISEFESTWGLLDPEKMGEASRRRRVARDYDLVILAPLGNSGGYYVNSATSAPGALTFLMRRHEGRWVVASHLTAAPPTPGFPPAWWIVGDPSVEALPD